MFSFRFMSNGSHTPTAGEELVEWEAVKDHVHSTRVAATLGSAMLLLIGIPSLYLLYGVPHPQKIAAVSEERAPLAVQEQAASASVPDRAALLIGNAQPAPQMQIAEVQPRKAVRNEGQRLSVRRTHESAAQGATRGGGPGVGRSTPQVPHAWYVQLAALSERGAAERLTHHVKTAGFPALLYDGSSSDNPRFRVLVGPQSSSAAAQQMQRKLGRLSFLEGTFVRYIE